MIVVDASVAVKWFVTEPDHEDALSILGSDESIIAPDLVVAETMHALRRKLRAGDVTEEQYLRAGADLAMYFDDLVPSASVVEEAARLSIRLDHGFYDCVYLALAVTSAATLVTADEVFEAKISSAGLSAVRGLSNGLSRRDAVPVAVSNATLDSIARLSRLVSETFTSLQDAHTAGERVQFFSTAIYQPGYESPAYLRLRQIVLELTPEERAEVIALGWLGRDYERGPFPSLLAHARSMFLGAPEKDVGYIMSVMTTVPAGYAKLRQLHDVSLDK